MNSKLLEVVVDHLIQEGNTSDQVDLMLMDSNVFTMHDQIVVMFDNGDVLNIDLPDQIWPNGKRMLYYSIGRER